MKKYGRELVLGSVAVSVLVLFSLVLLPALLVWVCPEGQEPPGLSSETTEAPQAAVKVFRHESGEVESIPLEEYVMGVVAGEMPAAFEPEALKAQAVAARTYAISRMRRSGAGNPAAHPAAPLCDDIHCQVYRTASQLRELKGDSWMGEGYKRIGEAVAATAGQVMYYKGALVEQPLFHSSSGGQTANSEDVFTTALPYLRSVDSPYEKEDPHQEETVSVSLKTFGAKIKSVYPGAGAIGAGNIKVTARSQGGRVQTLQAGKAKVSGRRIRALFGLRSANFTVKVSDENVLFTTSGYGHGVGMSQYGANGMAKAGYGYVDILSHYYSGVEVRVIAEADTAGLS